MSFKSRIGAVQRVADEVELDVGCANCRPVQIVWKLKGQPQPEFAGCLNPSNCTDYAKMVVFVEPEDAFPAAAVLEQGSPTSNTE